MAREAIPGLGGVTNRFGPRSLPEGKAGVVKTEGTIVQYVLHFSGTNYNSGEIEEPIIPAGFKPLRALVEVETAGAVGGTDTPTIEIGTNGTEVTNGFSVTEAQAEAQGVYVITSFNGTWAAQLAAATTVGVALDGTNPTLTGGKFKVTIEGYLA